MPATDLIIRATATKAPFRFVLVDLTHSANEIGKKHEARAHTLSLLADAAVASILLASGMKHAGAVSFLVEFSGDLSFVKADSTPMGLVRAMIPFDEIKKAGDFELLLSPLRLKVRRLDEKAHVVQESIVEAASERMGQNLAAFLMQSEQTKSGAGVISKTNAKDDTLLDYAIGFQIEAFPGAQDNHLEIMDMVIRDLPSLDTFQTPLGFDLRRLLDQLSGPFETEIVREIVPQHHCPCSKVRTMEGLAALPRHEIESLIEEEGDLEITCDFCRAKYFITPLDLREILDGRG